MTDVVIAANDKAKRAQIFGKHGIARKIFTHTMGNLDDSAQFDTLRGQDIVGHIGAAVGAFENILRTPNIHCDPFLWF